MDVSSKRSHSESDDDGDQERKLPRLVPYDSTDDYADENTLGTPFIAQRGRKCCPLVA